MQNCFTNGNGYIDRIWVSDANNLICWDFRILSHFAPLTEKLDLLLRRRKERNTEIK